MLNKKLIIYVLSYLFILNYTSSIFAQEKSEASIYNWFDNTIGKENTGINNGPLYTNPYKTIKDNNCFLVADKYTIGSVVYDGEPYFDVKLKYDIYTDQLILNPFGKFENESVALIQEKTTSFSIYNKDFIKHTDFINSIPEFKPGYYEIYKLNEKFNLYIKYHKDINKIVKDDGVFYSFKENNKFYIFYNNNYYAVSNKNSFIKIFPEFKSKIKSFYNLNSEVYKNDTSAFMKNISLYLNTLLNNKTN